MVEVPRPEAARLSALLFEAREQIDMWSDAVAEHVGVRDEYVDELVKRIDRYRAEQGWHLSGYGGEE